MNSRSHAAAGRRTGIPGTPRGPGWMLLGLLWLAPTQAEVYKCMVDARPVFSDVPCAPDAERVEVVPAYQSTGEPPAAALRPTEREELERIEDTQRKRSQARARARDAQHAQAARRATKETRQAPRCADYARRIGDSSDELRRGCPRERCERLRQRRARYERLMREQCAHKP